MAFLAPLVPLFTAIGTAAAVGGTAYTLLKKGPKMPSPLKPVTRDDVAEEIAAGDELRRRKGSLSDIMTGTRGLEAASGTVGKFIAGN